MDAFDDGIVTMDPDSNEEWKLIIEKKEVQKKKKPTDVERVCFHGSSVLDATPLNENEMGASMEEELDVIPDAKMTKLVQRALHAKNISFAALTQDTVEDVYEHTAADLTVGQTEDGANDEEEEAADPAPQPKFKRIALVSSKRQAPLLTRIQEILNTCRGEGKGEEEHGDEELDDTA